MTEESFVDTDRLVIRAIRPLGQEHNLTLQLFQEIFSTGTTVIGTQILQELAVCLRRKAAKRVSSSEIHRIISKLKREWELFFNILESILGAVALWDRLQVFLGMP